MPELPEAVASGDVRASLEAARNLLAVRAMLAGSRDIAGIIKELREVIGQLETLPVAEGSVSDDLAKQRAARRSRDRGAAAESEPRAAVSGVNRRRGGRAARVDGSSA